jgi:hypothetical protein
MEWSKRRKVSQVPQAISLQVLDFIKEANHFCDAVVTYDNGETHKLLARVLHNDIKNTWMINALDSHGHSISAKLIE